MSIDIDIDHKSQGKALRQICERKAHADFRREGNRPSLIDMIRQSDEDRVPELIPVRHARMSVSPFTFYRGTAGIMAQDLSRLPRTDIMVQAIGDCHLMNFGGYATPERTLIFDANDFDETLPASWEWDIKRLSTSFVLAARNNHLKEQDARDMAGMVINSYRTNMALFREMDTLDLWYMKFDLETIRSNTRIDQGRQLLDQAILKAHEQSNQKVYYKITSDVLGRPNITDHPPLVYHTADMEAGHAMISEFMHQYEDTLQADRRWLLDHYKIVDVALKVVGVGSVGTRCYVVLLMNERQHPLFLQVKEARQSVLEPYTGPGPYQHNGQRVVEGQRLTQAASDIFLGWSTGPGGRHFYVRQLRDQKMGMDVALFSKEVLAGYAALCGRMLARAHAKTGNAAVISGYMGKSDVLDKAIAGFAVAYADQTEKDYEEYIKAIRAGIFPVEEEAALKK